MLKRRIRCLNATLCLLKLCRETLRKCISQPCLIPMGRSLLKVILQLSSSDQSLKTLSPFTSVFMSASVPQLQSYHQSSRQAHKYRTDSCHRMLNIHDQQLNPQITLVTTTHHHQASSQKAKTSSPSTKATDTQPFPSHTTSPTCPPANPSYYAAPS